MIWANEAQKEQPEPKDFGCPPTCFFHLPCHRHLLFISNLCRNCSHVDIKFSIEVKQILRRFGRRKKRTKKEIISCFSNTIEGEKQGKEEAMHQ